MLSRRAAGGSRRAAAGVEWIVETIDIDRRVTVSNHFSRRFLKVGSLEDGNGIHTTHFDADVGVR